MKIRNKISSRQEKIFNLTQIFHKVLLDFQQSINILTDLNNLQFNTNKTKQNKNTKRYKTVDGNNPIISYSKIYVPKKMWSSATSLSYFTDYQNTTDVRGSY